MRYVCVYIKSYMSEIPNLIRFSIWFFFSALCYRTFLTTIPFSFFLLFGSCSLRNNNQYTYIQYIYDCDVFNSVSYFICCTCEWLLHIRWVFGYYFFLPVRCQLLRSRKHVSAASRCLFLRYTYKPNIRLINKSE